MFPEGATHITPMLVAMKENGRVTYFHGAMPVFEHDETDVRTFHMITSQFCCNNGDRFPGYRSAHYLRTLVGT
jgi:hypothetical protein